MAGPYHQILGEGCVYPMAVSTLGNQRSACGHPATWSADRTRHAERGDQYAARHDGFAFFQSVTANPAFCAAHILSSRPLPGDLARTSGTPAVSFLLAPNLCNDGHDALCADGAPRRPGPSRQVPGPVGAGHHRHVGLQGRRTDRGPVAEGGGTAACCGETSGLGPPIPACRCPARLNAGQRE